MTKGNKIVTNKQADILGRLNSLRGFFAIWIVIGHCSMYFDKELLPLLLIHKFNMIAVCYFFFASGWSMTYNVLNKADYFQHFVRNKIIFLAVIAVFSKVVGKVLFSLILGNSFLIGMDICTSLNWYIYEMMIFYIAFYVIHHLATYKQLRCILLILVTAIVALTTLHMGLSHSYYYSSFSFPFGVIMGYSYEHIADRYRKHEISYSFGLLAIALTCCLSLYMPSDTITGGIIMRNIMGICLMVLLTVVIQYINTDRIPFLSWLTRHSTEIYLYQFCILDLISRLYSNYRRNIDFSYVIAVVSLTIILSVVTHFMDVKIGRVIKVMK